ncbi:MAG: tetratricopeptide repeat protein [Candidatus Egerieousia sp.]
MSKIFLSVIALFFCFTHLQAQEKLKSALKKYDYVQAVNIIDSLINVVAPDSVSAVANKTELIDLSLQKSQCLKKLQRYEEASKSLVYVLQYDTGNVELLAELADCNVNTGNMESAIMLYSMLINLRPENLYFRLCYARILYRLNSYKDVISECDKILSLDTIPDVLYMKGNCFANIGQKDSAIIYYDKMLSINPLSAKAISRKSNILFDYQKYDEVLAMTDRYLEEFPNDVEILPFRGLAFYLKGKYDNSSETFDRIKELGDHSYSTHYYSGMSKYLLKRWNDAAEDFNAAYKIDTSDVKLLCKLADCYSYNPYKDSLSSALFDKALEMMKPDSSLVKNIYGRRASIAMRNKYYKKAIEDYKRYFEYDKTNVTVLSSIGVCYERLKDYKNAKYYYERFLKLANKDTLLYQFIKESLDYVKQELFMLEGVDK